MSASSSPRRAFLRQGALCLAGLGAYDLACAQADRAALFRVGLITDLHYADKPERGTRYYREALSKLDEAVATFNKERPAFVVELGDLIDQADTVEQELGWLGSIEARYARLEGPRHYLLGNHCVTTLTKDEFLAHTGFGKSPHYTVSERGVTFIALDACFRSDGTAYGRKNFDWKDTSIPAFELDWLKGELGRASGPVIVLAHQRLDENAAHSVKNAAEVRAVLESSGKVLAVFQGHSHKNDYQQINGIHYTTLVAMVEGSGSENSGYSLLDVFADGSLKLQGFRRQNARELAKKGHL